MNNLTKQIISATLITAAIVLGQRAIKSQAPTPRPLGTLTLGAPDTTNCPLDFVCTNFTVSIPNISLNATGELGVQKPTGPIKGMVLFFSESTGTTWWQYGASTYIEPSTVPPFFASLLNSGYEIVQIKWNLSWARAPTGVQAGQVALAGRSATVIKWVHDNWFTGGRFCLTGSSGGAAQVAYAVAAYRLDSIVDILIPTGGPPMSQLTRGCMQETGWAYRLDKQQLIDLSYGYFHTTGPCELHDPNFSATWDANSNDAAGLNFFYPNTKVHIIIGSGGPGTFDYNHANAYFAALLSAGQNAVLQQVSTMGHEIASSADGLTALYNALTAALPTPTPTPNGTAFITSMQPGTIRNDSCGLFGMAITVGPNPIAVNSLGRLVAPGNSQVHTLEIVDPISGMAIASTAVNTQGAGAGAFLYGNLASPITLSANSTYYILSQEASGGDQWYDFDTTVTTTSDASLIGAVSGSAAPYNLTSTSANEYVPLDFAYTLATTPSPTPTPTSTPTPTPPPVIQVTVQTNPAGFAITVDGTTYSAAPTFSWTAGSSHTIGTSSPQAGGSGIQYVWKNWTGGGAISHTIITPTKNVTYTASFTKQYYLTMTAGTGGSISPTSGWRNSGAIVAISATPANTAQISYSFSGWTGTGTGSYSGTNNPASITMNGPITETAAFTQNPVQVIVQMSLSGLSFTVDGITYTAAQSFSWAPGSSHTIATTSPQNGASGTRYVWLNWTDGGAISHTVAPTTNKTYTAKFTTQYYLTMSTGTGGKVSPSSGWRSSGTAVSMTATPSSGYTFGGWTGSGTGSYSGGNNPASITMSAPITEAAAFSPSSTPTPTPSPSATLTPSPTP
jgi:hypothetical protein